MSSFYGIDSSSTSSFFNNFFGTSSSSSSSSSGVLGSLGDYGMIQSGAYKKLLTKYYAENGDEKTTNSITTSAQSDTVNNLLSTKSSSSAMVSSAKELTSLSLEDESKDDLTKKVKSFVDNYNALIEDLGSMESVSVLQTGVWMTNETKSNENVLNNIGITIGEGNKLTLDETKLKSATNAQLKTVLEGNESVVGQLSIKANAIATMSGKQALLNQRGSSYSSTGSYNVLSTSQLYNSLT